MDNIDEWLKRATTPQQAKTVNAGSQNSSSTPKNQQKPSFHKRRKFKKFNKPGNKPGQKFEHRPHEESARGPGGDHRPQKRYQMRPGKPHVRTTIPKTRQSRPAQILK